MIIWQGFGFLAVVIPLIVFVLAGVLNTGAATDSVLAAIFFVSGVLVWLAGRKLNSKPGKILIDPETQQEVELKNKHTLFWIPMEWISIGWILLAVFSLIH